MTFAITFFGGRHNFSSSLSLISAFSLYCFSKLFSSFSREFNVVGARGVRSSCFIDRRPGPSWLWWGVISFQSFRSLKLGLGHSSLKSRPNDRNMSTQHIAILLGAICCARLVVLLGGAATCQGVVSSNLATFNFEPTTPNMSQLVATCKLGAVKAENTPSSSKRYSLNSLYTTLLLYKHQIEAVFTYLLLAWLLVKSDQGKMWSQI